MFTLSNLTPDDFSPFTYIHTYLASLNGLHVVYIDRKCMEAIVILLRNFQEPKVPSSKQGCIVIASMNYQSLFRQQHPIRSVTLKETIQKTKQNKNKRRVLKMARRKASRS